MAATDGRRPPTTPKSLATYLDTLRDRPQELRTVSRTIDPGNFEVTAILEHLDRRGEFPAVLVENPLDMHGQATDFQLVSNLWATRERVAEMLGLEPHQSGRELGPRFASFMDRRQEPVTVGSDDAPVQAHVHQGKEADMWTLPAVRHFEMDLGAVLTMAHVMHAPGQDFYNVTFVKTFPKTGSSGGLTIHTPHLTRMLREWERKGERIPIVNPATGFKFCT